MKITHIAAVGVARGKARRTRCAGFTLVELLVAMAVFLVIGGAAMSLFRMHVSQFTDQQNQVGLNTSLRNALTQIEVDIANAGTGYYVGNDQASFPIGVTIISGGGAGCNAGTTYAAACFDTLNIISTDSTTPPGAPDGAGACTDTTAGVALIIPPPVVNPATGANWTAAQYAAKFNLGDQVLWANGLNYNTAYVTAAGGAAGGDASVPHRPTSAAGVGNSTGPAGTDPLGISGAPDPRLATSFCSTTGVVVKLAPTVIYGVDTATNPANPRLFRQVGALGAQSVVSDQIIGFRVVATLLNNTIVTNFNPATANYNQIRTVQVSVIGRTPPNPESSFRNVFDGGAYKIESLSVTANPRNLSMND
jgi:prepilin-type N-terminal cleavage/methylation domain-containing protein